MSDPSPDPSPSPSPAHRSDGDVSRRANRLSLVALVVAVVAIALAGWATYRASNAGSSEPAYTDTQRAEAKGKTCAAYSVVRRGTSINTNLQPPGGPEDVTGALAVAANARVALYDGGQYLLARLDPATPPDLADAVRKFANNLMDIGAEGTAGAQNTDPAQVARMREVDTANATIIELCK